MIIALLCVLVVLEGIALIGAYAWIMEVERDLDGFRDEMYERFP